MSATENMSCESSAGIKAELNKFALQLGFDACRIAACSAPEHTDQFAQWLEAGAHGEMDYMRRGEEKRRDPQKILPGAKSIIVLALNYFTETAEPGRTAPVLPDTAKKGRIARYAW